MADRIRGITIEIGGDTSGLTKSLKQSNTELNSTKSQLKDVNSLLKLDPTNIDLLQQKEKLLNDTVAETAKKVEDLKALQAQMDAAGVDHNSEQYMALQREIISTENALQGARDAADGYNAKLEQVAAKSQAVADKSAQIAEKTWGITAAVAAMGVGAVQTTADFDEKMSQLAATMGVPVDQIQNLRDFAKEMGATTAFSASEAAEGLNVLAMSGLSAEEQMAVLPSVLNLAAAGGIDMATAASYVVGSIKGFNGEMTDAATYADLMAKGATMAATDVNGLGEAMSGISATASSYGQSAEEVAKACLMLAEQNVTGSEAVTGLNRVMSDLYTPTSAAAKQLKKLGVSAFDAEGNARPLVDVIQDIDEATEGMSDKKKSGVLSKIFSDEGLKTFNKMAASSTEKVEQFAEGLENAGGSAGQQAETMLDNLNGQLTLLKSALEGAAITIGEKLIPYIQDFVSWIQKAVDWFNGLSEGQMKLILIIAGVVASIAPIAGIVSKISTAVGFLSKSVLPKLKKAFAFLKANPFLLIITAVITLVTIIGKNAEKIREYLNKVDEFLQGVFAKDFTEIFGDKLGGVINAFMAYFKAVWDGFKSVLDWVINICEKMVSGDWAGVWEDLKNLFKPAIDWIKEKWQGLCDFVTALLDGDFKAAFGEESTFGQALTNFSTFVSGIWDDITGFFQGAYDTVKALFEGDFKTVFGEESTIGKALTDFSSFVSGIWDSITGFFSGAYDTVKSLFEGDFSSVFGEGSAIRTAFDGVKGFFSDTWETMKTNFTEGISAIGSLFDGDFSNVFKEGSPIRTAFDGVKGFFSDTWETIKTNFTEGKDAVSGLFSGDFSAVFADGSPIRTAFDGCKTFFSDTWSSITGFFDGGYEDVEKLFKGDFSDVFGEGSAIRSAFDGCKTFFSDTWETIKKNFSDNKEAINTVWNADFTKVFGEDSELGKAMNTFRDGVNTKLEAVKGFFTDTTDTVGKLLEGDFAGVFGEGSPVGEALENFKTKCSEKMESVKGFFSGAASNVKSIMDGDFAGVFGDNSLVCKGINKFNSLVDSVFGEGGIKARFQEALDFVKTTFAKGWSDAWEGLKNSVSKIWDGLAGTIKKPINSVIKYLNKMIDRVNGFIDEVNSFSVLGWSTNIGHIGKISELAKGGVVPMGGMALVGERGPEMLTVSNGHATVTPLGGSAGGNVINVYTQQMTEAQVDYLIARVNGGLLNA